MPYLYFDESIRDDGAFIVGALVVSEIELSPTVCDAWRAMGKNPDVFEYKSSAPKASDPLSQKQRDVLIGLLQSCRLALVVCARDDRSKLGEHCLALILQLLDTKHLKPAQYTLFLDQGISVSNSSKAAIAARGVTVEGNRDSRIIAGIQVADHAAHVLGIMLREQVGLSKKTILVGEEVGYDPPVEIELGYELWAGLRHLFYGLDDEISETSAEEGPVDRHRKVQGHGLYIAPSCNSTLCEHTLRCFGLIYLGCIH